jgi:hypothetical protein
MKTIFDAVNEFEAVWPEKSYNTIWVSRHDSHEAFKFGSIVTDDAVCTTEEFNTLVSDLENWQPTPLVSPLANVTYAEYKEKFMSESKPKLETIGGDGGKDFTVKNKTVESYGMVYELDKSYITSVGEIAILVGLGFPGGFLVSYPHGGSRLVSNGLTTSEKWTTGTITPAPVDLVDGAGYSFEYMGKDMLGRYHKWSNRFVIGNSNIKANKVKGITRLVLEVKS